MRARGRRRGHRALLAATAAALAAGALALPGLALAAFPYSAGDPHDYSSYRTDPGEAPGDLQGKVEWMYAATPDDSPDPLVQRNNADPHELGGVRGAHVVDRDPDARTAWLTTAGRPDVTIAVLDSGIEWNDFGAMMDVRKKTRISDGELPLPQVDRDTATEPGVDCGDYRRGRNDANDDGVFNVLDYACDSRVSADDPRNVGPDWPSGDPLLEPQDVLIAFSDGSDADHNGFVDDIVGWDFLDDDNDPYDDVQYGHGTGEARDSAGEADNGGDLGTCPNCMEIHMRVGDSFIADVNRFAQAVIYATDNDVLVVQEALGTLNKSKLGADAVKYAYDHGVAVIASAADEAAQHHNWPSSYPHVIIVNSVEKYDPGDPGNPSEGRPPRPPPTPLSRSYLQFNGCTNFSSKITVAIPSVSCSSDATGRGAGQAGLIYSAALNAYEDRGLEPHPDCRRTNSEPCLVSANEVRQLMASGAIEGQGQSDDVNFADTELSCEPVPAPECTDPNTNALTPERDVFTTSPVATTKSYPAKLGHDQFYGWGRANLRKAVEALVPPGGGDALIPPEVEITGPEWFEQIDPGASSFTLRGQVGARGRSFSCRVLVAPGSYPNNREAPAGDFEEVPSAACDGNERNAAVDGVLAEIGVDELKSRFPPTTGDFRGREPGQGEQSRDGRPNTEPYGFTVKVVATVDEGGDELTGEDRRNMFVHRDQDLLDGWPKHLAGDGESSPLFVDLDGDNRNELVVANSDGVVHAWRRDGSELPGWPVRGDRLPLHDGGRAFESGDVSGGASGAFLASVAAGDLDRDGAPEIVGSDLEGKVYAWDAEGRRVFEEEAETRFSGKPLQPFENVRQGKRNRTQHGFLGSPVLADVDGDDGGRPEIVAANMDRHVYAWNGDGSRVDGFPALVVDRSKVASIEAQTHAVRFGPQAGTELDQGAIIDTPAVGDIAGDERPEIVVGTNEEYKTNDGSEGPFNASGFNTASYQALTAAFGPANGRLYALRPEGDTDGDPMTDDDLYVDGWPMRVGILLSQVLPVVGEGITGSPVIGEASCPDGGDGPKVGVLPAAGPAYVLNANGRSCYGRPDGRDAALQSDFAASTSKYDTPIVPAFGHPAFGELPGGGAFLAPVTGLVRALDVALNEYQGGQDFMGAWDTSSGQFRPGWPSRLNDLQFLTGPSIADLDGQPGEEIVAGSAHNDLGAFNAAGAPMSPAWPKTTSDWTVANPLTGSFGTLDTDDGARKAVVALTRSGTVFAYGIDAPACSPASWPRFHHDNANSGDARRDAALPGRPMDAVVSGGALTFRAPGDDLLCGRAQRYEVVTSDTEIDGDDFDQAEPVSGAPAPGEPGASESVPLTGGLKRFVGVRAVDDQGNVGRPAVVDTQGAGPQAGPGAPACLPGRARIGMRGLGPIRLGRGRAAVRGAVGTPVSSSRWADRFCVDGGGVVTVGYRRGRAALAASRAGGHFARLNPGDRGAQLRRARRRARRVKPGLYLNRRARKAFAVRRGRIVWVAVVDGALARSPRALALMVRRARP